MTAEPRPLGQGTLLAERFQIERLLGRGGFSLAYLAKDRERGDEVVVKELAPAGLQRREDDVLELAGLGQTQAMHLRQRFLEEAVLLGRLNLRGLLPVRSSFSQNGTAYYATDYIAGVVTLDDMMRGEGQMHAQGALDLMYQLLETLEEVHRRGYLHRDIKPSNILVTPRGEAVLIDFGAAREWHADATIHNTVLYTPGYAPIEQLSELGRRGPATDLYALAATFYHALTGSLPPGGADRLEGVPLIPLSSVRPDVDRGVSAAIEACLQPRYSDRPQSIAELRELLTHGTDEPDAGGLEHFDKTLLALQRFSFDRRECPACNGVLEEPKPLRSGACPVCQRGIIKMRDIPERLCPNCSASPLHRIANHNPLSFCPLCHTGRLARKRKGLLKPEWTVNCLQCEAQFEEVGGAVKLLQHGKSRAPRDEVETWEEWLQISGRSSEVWMCDGCFAQYDAQPDGRWLQVDPEPRKYTTLYPEEWARVASKLSPGAGNAECDGCAAEYFVEGQNVTLLAAPHDPNGFERAFQGRLLTFEGLRWLGVGKDSPHPGFVCKDCGTEFDTDGAYLRLMRTDQPRLNRHELEAKTLEDWHRLGRGLPSVAQEAGFLGQAEDVLADAYRCGSIGFDPKGEIAWRGPAVRGDDNSTGTFTVNSAEISFGGLLRKWRVPIDVLEGARSQGDILALHLGGEPEPIEFRLEPVELTVHLSSGDQSMLLTAPDLAARLTTTVKVAT